MCCLLLAFSHVAPLARPSSSKCQLTAVLCSLQAGSADGGRAEADTFQLRSSVVDHEKVLRRVTESISVLEDEVRLVKSKIVDVLKPAGASGRGSDVTSPQARARQRQAQRRRVVIDSVTRSLERSFVDDDERGGEYFGDNRHSDTSESKRAVSPVDVPRYTPTQQGYMSLSVGHSRAGASGSRDASFSRLPPGLSAADMQLLSSIRM